MMRLTELQIDALKEVANIGAGHAATALSQLLNTIIKLEAPRAEVIRFGQLSARVAEGRVFAVLHVYVRGDIPGHLVVLLDHQDALQFVGLFLKRVGGDFQIFDAVVETTLKELANIVASSYLGAVVQLTGANMVPSVPVISYGSMQATFEALMPISPQHDVFFVESTFLDRGARICGHFIFVPETGSLEPLLAAFGVS
ncbi:MAG: chemotaxis protein CheC [Candidatus Eremiobacteraeota bacterium]|nr:chemotaxis protein CheC [Candidatus Eremiobacteraeota bacterium]MBV8720845.1 chemotaxis protein CheC [Candidatus Eremiobacteraeota bacterium]